MKQFVPHNFFATGQQLGLLRALRKTVSYDKIELMHGNDVWVQNFTDEDGIIFSKFIYYTAPFLTIYW